MGDEENTENVVRFPRNWVGPTDELVPIGPRARARAREAEEREERAERGSGLTDDPEAIPAAGDFWGEGAAALHHPIRAPSPGPDAAPDESTATAERTPADASAAADARALAGDRRRRRGAHADARRHLRPPRPRAPRLLHGPRSRGRMAAVGGACLVVAAVAVIVTLGAFGAIDRHASTATHATGRPLVSFATLRSDGQTGIRAIGMRVIGMRVRYESGLARARAVARTEGRLAAETTKHIRHRKHAYFVELRKRRAASTPVQYTQLHESIDTDTSPDVVDTSPSATDATAETSDPSTSDASSSSATGDYSSGSAPAGPTGVGGSTGGCNPQCR